MARREAENLPRLLVPPGVLREPPVRRRDGGVAAPGELPARHLAVHDRAAGHGEREGACNC